MKRRAFLCGVAAAAVAIPLAPLLPKMPPRTIASAPGELIKYTHALYTPKYVYGYVRVTDAFLSQHGTPTFDEAFRGEYQALLKEFKREVGMPFSLEVERRDKNTWHYRACAMT